MDYDPLILRQSVYQPEFNHFLKTSVEVMDLQVLLNCKPRIIESIIIVHIERLRNVEKLSYWTIQMHCAVILHFFEMNDVSLNAKRSKGSCHLTNPIILTDLHTVERRLIRY